MLRAIATACAREFGTGLLRAVLYEAGDGLIGGKDTTTVCPAPPICAPCPAPLKEAYRAAFSCPSPCVECPSAPECPDTSGFVLVLLCFVVVSLAFAVTCGFAGYLLGKAVGARSGPSDTQVVSNAVLFGPDGSGGRRRRRGAGIFE